MIEIQVPVTCYVGLCSGVNHGGQGGTVPSKVLTGGTAVLTVPPKFKLRRDTAGFCFVRFHKEYVTYYNFDISHC